MIDNIHFIIPQGDWPKGVEPKSNYPGKIEGSLKNLKIWQNGPRVHCRGSLQKFHQGNNLMPFAKADAEASLKKLEAITGWNLKHAVVLSLEFGQTFAVDHPVNSYLSSWGLLPRYKRNITCSSRLESATYFTGKEKLIAYDKYAELKVKRNSQALEIWQKEYKGKFPLRIELKLLRKMSHWFDGPISPWDLLNDRCYQFLLNRWYRIYQKIPKGPTQTIQLSKMTARLLERALAAQIVQEWGEALVLGIVNDLVMENRTSKQNGSRARETIRELNRSAAFLETDIYTRELDRKVQALANNVKVMELNSNQRSRV